MQFVVNPRVTVDFVRNKAKVLGGGIMANSLIPALFEFDNKYCFIRYVDPDVPPQKWNNISINFINNTATAGGAAIYGCDLGACSWLNLSTHDSMNAGMHTILSHGGNVSLPFLFSGNFLSDDNPEKIVTNNGTIGTDPVTINETFHTKVYAYTMPSRTIVI
jgi:predicted outer membrane repeat protein